MRSTRIPLAFLLIFAFGVYYLFFINTITFENGSISSVNVMGIATPVEAFSARIAFIFISLLTAIIFKILNTDLLPVGENSFQKLLALTPISKPRFHTYNSLSLFIISIMIMVAFNLIYLLITWLIYSSPIWFVFKSLLPLSLILISLLLLNDIVNQSKRLGVYKGFILFVYLILVPLFLNLPFYNDISPVKEFLAGLFPDTLSLTQEAAQNFISARNFAFENTRNWLFSVGFLVAIWISVILSKHFSRKKQG